MFSLPHLPFISLQKTNFLVLDSNGRAREPQVRIGIRISASDLSLDLGPPTVFANSLSIFIGPALRSWT